MRCNHLNAIASFFRNRDLALALQNRVHSLQHGVLRQRNLVQQENIAVLHRRKQRTVLPREDRLVPTERFTNCLHQCSLLVTHRFVARLQLWTQPAHDKAGRFVE